MHQWTKILTLMAGCIVPYRPFSHTCIRTWGRKRLARRIITVVQEHFVQGQIVMAAVSFIYAWRILELAILNLNCRLWQQTKCYLATKIFRFACGESQQKTFRMLRKYFKSLFLPSFVDHINQTCTVILFFVYSGECSFHNLTSFTNNSYIPSFRKFFHEKPSERYQRARVFMLRETGTNEL